MNENSEPRTEGAGKSWYFYLLLAVQFLTILPVRLPGETEESDFGRSTALFPVVGLLQGLILLVVYKLFSLALPGAVVDVFILLTLVFITGGLHVDGFSDTVDGFAGKREKAETLRIMNDSNVGAFAVTGIALLSLLKYAGLSSLPVDHKSGVIVSIPVFSVWSMVLLARLHDYAREEGGTGKAFVRNTGNRELTAASIITVIVTVAAMGFYALLIYLLIFLTTLLMGEYSRYRLGGVTGDVLGAAKEVNDAMVLLFALIFLSA
jgi:adenosylcobinamide-GDP ribazoletransferase